MRRTPARVAAALAVATAIAVPAISGPQAVATGVPDPTTWSNHRLATQLVLAGVHMDHLNDAKNWSANGIGGLVLFGTPPANLGTQLSAVRSAGAVPPLVSSDEEGGEVQRLAAVIYRLHSAQWFGANRTPAQVRDIARRYAVHMHALGVDVDLAPDADLKVAGNFLTQEQRTFASDPQRVGRYVNAWQLGMRDADVATTVKHWPGHGHATNSHTSTATTPPLSYLKQHDLLPFEAAFAQHVPIVMVGHLIVPGLTPKYPASLSFSAYHFLRHQAGTKILVVTDALTMDAVRNAGFGPASAAVRALEAGADMALVDTDNPWPAVRKITAALDSGDYPRARAIASVRRIIAVKQLTGSVPAA